MTSLKKYIPRVITFVLYLGVLFGGYKVITYSLRKNATAQTKAMDTMCPTLMSIGRTSRDTLLIMRVEPLCTEYVLSNLK